MGVVGRPTRGAPVIAEHSSDNTKHIQQSKKETREERGERGEWR